MSDDLNILVFSEQTDWITVNISFALFLHPFQYLLCVIFTPAHPQNILCDIQLNILLKYT